MRENEQRRKAEIRREFGRELCLQGIPITDGKKPCRPQLPLLASAHLYVHGLHYCCPRHSLWPLCFPQVFTDHAFLRKPAILLSSQLCTSFLQLRPSSPGNVLPTIDAFCFSSSSNISPWALESGGPVGIWIPAHMSTKLKVIIVPGFSGWEN